MGCHSPGCSLKANDHVTLQDPGHLTHMESRGTQISSSLNTTSPGLLNQWVDFTYLLKRKAREKQYFPVQCKGTSVILTIAWASRHWSFWGRFKEVISFNLNFSKSSCEYIFQSTTRLKVITFLPFSQLGMIEIGQS